LLYLDLILDYIKTLLITEVKVTFNSFIFFVSNFFFLFNFISEMVSFFEFFYIIFFLLFFLILKNMLQNFILDKTFFKLKKNYFNFLTSTNLLFNLLSITFFK